MNNDNIPPNTDPQLYSLIGIAIGMVLSANFNTNELNSIGNWLILIGQYALTYTAQAQLIDSRKIKNNYDIELLKKAIDKIQEEINKI